MGQPVSVQDLPGILYQAGFRGTALIQAMAVALAEAGYTGHDNSTGNSPAGSVDRGLFQINSYWHPEVSDTCAADPICNAKAAYTISGGGANWSAWSTWNEGVAQQYLAKAGNLVALAGDLANVVGFGQSVLGVGTSTNPTGVPQPSVSGASAAIQQAIPNPVKQSFSDVTGALSSLASSVATTTNDVGQSLSDARAIISFLQTPALWTRLVLGALGALLLLVGLVLFAASFIPKGSVKVPAVG